MRPNAALRNSVASIGNSGCGNWIGRPFDCRPPYAKPRWLQVAVSDRRGRGPPPVVPDGRSSTRCGSTPWATGPDDHQGPVGEGRTPPGHAPTATQSAQRIQPPERTAQLRRAANGQARKLCCLSRWAPAQFANLLGEFLGGSGRSIGRALTAVLLMKWSFEPRPLRGFFLPVARERSGRKVARQAPRLCRRAHSPSPPAPCCP